MTAHRERPLPTAAKNPSKKKPYHQTRTLIFDDSGKTEITFNDNIFEITSSCTSKYVHGNNNMVMVGEE